MYAKFLIYICSEKSEPKSTTIFTGNLLLYLWEYAYYFWKVLNILLILTKRGDFLSRRLRIKLICLIFTFSFAHYILKLLEFFIVLDLDFGAYPIICFIVYFV